jgi:hypothetical protein
VFKKLSFGMGLKGLVVGGLLFAAVLPLQAADLPQYSPDAGVFLINEMSWMLRDYPRFLPINVTFFGDGINEETSSGSIDDANFGRIGLSFESILPVPRVSWLSIAAHLTGVLDAQTIQNENTGPMNDDSSTNFNTYLGGGIIGDFTPFTLGVFVGRSTALEYVSMEGEDEHFREVSGAKLILVPILKTQAIGLSFLKYIVNYINFGNFEPQEISYGQTFMFATLEPGGHSLQFGLYYNNERYNFIARNWVYALQTNFDPGNKGGIYMNLEAGYQDFYDQPSGISYVDDAPLFKGMLGFDFSKETVTIDEDGNEKKKRTERGVWVKGLWDFQGLGFGFGGVIKGVQLDMELIPNGKVYTRTGVTLIRMAVRLYIPGW